MSLAPYRRVLAIRGVRALLLSGIVARIPATAIGITLTLHVTTALGRSWAQAGLVIAAYTIGAAVGAPFTGRLLDRRGLRFTMALTAGVEAAVWVIAPSLSYTSLLIAAVVGGVFSPPVFPAVRMGLAAMVPGEQRRTAYALDSMIVELSYMVGPAIAVVLSTTLPQGVALYLVGAGVVGTAALLWWLNSPMQPEGGQIPHQAPSRRSWLKPRLVALMVVAVAATFVLSATEITVVATLDDAGLKHWTGLTIALWCLYSLVGGLVFGAGKWRASAVGLVAAMAALTIPIGLGSGWPWLLLALLPSGVLCAPTMTATNDHLAKIVPPAAQGEANGVLGSAFTLGISMGAPFAGVVIDQWGTTWAYAAVGTLGLLAALAAVPVARLAPRASVDGTDGPAPAADPVPETAAA